MAKLFSTPAEAVALRSMCSRDLQISGKLISQLSEDYFYSDEGKESYLRILKLFNDRGEVPSYKLLCEDVGLSEDAREFLRGADGLAKNAGQVDQIVNSLNKYRQTRHYYKLAKRILSHLEQSKIDPDELSEIVSKTVTRVQLRQGANAEIIRIGKDSNLKEALTELLYDESDDQVIPTGFKTFDSVNGGFIRGSLVIIGGSSGAGKCCVPDTLVQMANMELEFNDGVKLEFPADAQIVHFLTPNDQRPVRADSVKPGMRIKGSQKVRVLKAIRPATRTLQQLATQALLALDTKEIPAAALHRLHDGTASEVDMNVLRHHLITLHPHPRNKGDVDAFTIPLEIEVETRLGRRTTNGLYVTRACTKRLFLERSIQLEATLSHKMMLHGSLEWRKVDDLKVGDMLMTPDGEPVKILEISEIQPAKLVMDICVPGIHEYVANGLVSHNSILANQLNVNQSSMGYKTTLAPLEMTGKEMLSRTTASHTGTNGIDIMLQRLATEERDKIWRKMMRMDRKTRENGGQYTIFKPKEDVSIEELMASLAAIPSDVIYVDYISLLKGVDGDDQWQKLGQVARFCKIQADNLNKVVVLLCQVSEEGKVRYSQAIKEHASLAWIFVATKESRERGYLNIDMLKSRNQIKRPFTLKIDYNKTQVGDLSPEELERIGQEGSSSDDSPKRGRRSEGDDGGKPVPKKRNREGDSADYTPDLSE